MFIVHRLIKRFLQPWDSVSLVSNLQFSSREKPHLCTYWEMRGGDSFKINQNKSVDRGPIFAR